MVSIRGRFLTKFSTTKGDAAAKAAPVVPAGVSVIANPGPLKAMSTVEKAWSIYHLGAALYHWGTCLFVIGLVLSQLLGAVKDTTSSTSHALYGRSPDLGPYQIIGYNDIPYADRLIACVKNGEFYEPRTVGSLLAKEGTDAIVEDTTGNAVTGYRIMLRRPPSVRDTLDSLSQSVYQASCELIAKTIDNVLNACSSLGYENLARDYLRVVDGVNSRRLVGLPNALPVLIMPYWDNAASARHAVPTLDGDACIFRLEDAYSGYVSESGESPASFRGVNQSVRHERTMHWLQRPGGVWKNGWYEDSAGMKWYSDVVSTAKAAPYYMMHRMFDMRTGLEVDCSIQTNCENTPLPVRWGENFETATRSTNVNSVFIANGTQYGFFLYEADQVRTVRSVFDWQTLVSNISLGLVLMRWLVTLYSLHLGAVCGKISWFGGGLGCLSGAQSFFFLPIASLPRMNITLTVFFTVGCYFEGEQAGLAEAWFAMYPGIALFVFVYFSLLNTLAKILRRRMYDGLFAPTLIALCLLHHYRVQLAVSAWLASVDARVPTLIFSDEARKLQLSDYFTSNVAYRMDGRVKQIFGIKMGILAANLLPLLLARPLPVMKRGTVSQLNGMEKALAVRAACVGGLGLSSVYSTFINIPRRKPIVMTDTPSDQASELASASDDVRHVDTSCSPEAVPVGDDSSPEDVEPTLKTPPRPVVLLNSYELIRLGYLVFGDQYVITFDEWDILSSMSLFRAFVHLWNHRVLVWKLRDVNEAGDAEKAGGRELESTEPEMWRLDDPRLLGVSMWRIDACAVQC